jgi:hypothetical protein
LSRRASRSLPRPDRHSIAPDEAAGGREQRPSSRDRQPVSRCRAPVSSDPFCGSFAAPHHGLREIVLCVWLAQAGDRPDIVRKLGKARRDDDAHIRSSKRGSAKIECRLKGRVLSLKAGDVLVLPAGTGHRSKIASRHVWSR